MSSTPVERVPIEVTSAELSEIIGALTKREELLWSVARADYAMDVRDLRLRLEEGRDQSQ